MQRDPKQAQEMLAAPFSLHDVKFKPQVKSNGKALAVPFVDARSCEDRLDEVLGIDGWQDSYQPLPDGNVMCVISVLFGDSWISKSDVGGVSEQPDAGDRNKAAFSDAFKRTCVKWGVGRYLYRIPAIWALHDGKQWQENVHNKLPPEARPKAQQPKPNPPVSGAALKARVLELDAQFAAKEVAKKGEFTKFVVDAAVQAGLDADMLKWGPGAVDLCKQKVDEFEKQKGVVRNGAKS